MHRRQVLTTGLATLALPMLGRGAFAAVSGRPLPIPPLAEAGGGVTTLTAAFGQSAFFDGRATPSWGYSQPFLGPTLRMKRGATARMRVENRLDFEITSHWHGGQFPGHMDGGPQLAIAPGAAWEPELEVDQPPATLWYHSHSHGFTAEQVYGGLAGMLQIVDPDRPDGLPGTYGEDDLPLVIQDRTFTESGGFSYAKQGPTRMHGFRGDQILVNGAIRPEAGVPAGLVRLRLLNGSNARIYHLRFSDGRRFHQVASEGGLLPAPVVMDGLTLAPAERAEIVVDFSDGAPVVLWSGADTNDPMSGMMGGLMGRGSAKPPRAVGAPRGVFEIMRFAPDPARPGKVASLPGILPAEIPDLGEPVRRRRFELSMMGGRGMMGGGGMGGMGAMTINGRSHDMARVDVQMRLGETELWEVIADEMAHPFHVHGTQFLVASRNGKPVDQALSGLKDVALVDGHAELLVQVNRKADARTPYMFHCHILEHEDSGMMGQFTVA